MRILTEHLFNVCTVLNEYQQVNSITPEYRFNRHQCRVEELNDFYAFVSRLVVCDSFTDVNGVEQHIYTINNGQSCSLYYVSTAHDSAGNPDKVIFSFSTQKEV